jgi:hypothetical protein
VDTSSFMRRQVLAWLGRHSAARAGAEQTPQDEVCSDPELQLKGYACRVRPMLFLACESLDAIYDLIQLLFEVLLKLWLQSLLHTAILIVLQEEACAD